MSLTPRPLGRGTSEAANDPAFAKIAEPQALEPGKRPRRWLPAGNDVATIPHPTASTATLSMDVLECLASTLSTNTQRAYSGDLQDFVAWGGGIPSTPQQLAEYVARRAAEHAIATIRRRVAGISAAHVRQALEDPARSTLVKAVLRGIKRGKGRPQRQVEALSPTAIGNMVGPLEGLRGARDKALILTGFGAALRRSELVGLDVSDVLFRLDGMVLRLRRSKTDQDNHGRSVFVPNGVTIACPTVALKNWLRMAGLASGPIFRPIDHGQKIQPCRLSAQSVALIVKRHAHLAGISASAVSGHSLRAGWITSAARAGATDHMLRRQSGHRTASMLARYIRMDASEAMYEVKSIL